MMNTFVQPATRVLDDPKRLLARTLPLDRSAILRLVTAVLAPQAPVTGLRPEDCLQIGQLLAGHASILADDVCELLSQQPPDSRLRPITESVLTEARGRLSIPPRATLPSVQNRARLVRALYRRLDLLESARLS